MSAWRVCTNEGGNENTEWIGCRGISGKVLAMSSVKGRCVDSWGCHTSSPLVTGMVLAVRIS